jgi:hypothetical protein
MYADETGFQRGDFVAILYGDFVVGAVLAQSHVCIKIFGTMLLALLHFRHRTARSCANDFMKPC